VGFACSYLCQQLFGVPAMNPKAKLKRIINRWPVALIILGGVLTLLWLVLLISFSLSMLQTL
jgi:hypothetical protein